MKYIKLRNIEKSYFGYEEIAKTLGISLVSARVSANRYVKQGLLLRVKRNLYVLKEKWEAMGRENKFILANLAQVPSYISLMTALDYYEITTQMQRSFIESVAIKRTKEISVEEAIFNYNKINENLYFGFLKKRGFFIASPEKAFLDAMYLASLKRYNIDVSSIDFTKLDKAILRKMIKKFPAKTQIALEGYEYFRKA